MNNSFIIIILIFIIFILYLNEQNEEKQHKLKSDIFFTKLDYSYLNNNEGKFYSNF